ncbi:hypothetical protein AXD46_19715 [Salmonella enterica]|uniref:Uncharacterized protein n=1 Tax=Salmonella enterica TaxID=28901 RepID=A0A3V9VP28_SALER|nr:hypothetical protein [Salmonella enterica]EAA6248344.1 hypothetical protein [Salmonella enterica subsp. salamae]EBE1546447.1 hypothetical protein [Salmonella enterica subsp. enterica]EDU4962239.1 hypothetical protein [Salmonella enterica subsp. enterica serovar Saintpaul]EAA9518740.1 hypothetical protein [Salmonella enterica]EAP4931238.1 hypothetical protein [Salmonella enterica]
MSRFPTETIIAPASTLKDFSGHTVAGAGKEIMPADAAARLYRIQNLSKTETLWFNDTGSVAAAGAPGSYALAPGGYYEFSSTHAVSVYANTVVAFSAARY